ncbi:MAG TPA: ABC transporter ATP-binding protein [Chloroflexota bacterium]|nr:ABC transporter ATP-binding protein [Chloroflexota bacterium]
MMIQEPDTILEVRGLTKLFPASRSPGLWGGRRYIHAVDDVSFALRRGQILALVGESGSGKSTIARLLARLYPATAGRALFHGSDALQLRGRDLLRYRGKVQMVFQDPFGSLNPVKTVGHHLERPLLIQRQAEGRRATRQRVQDLLATVGLTPPAEVAAKLPHELSGGQRQRVALARALAVNPEVILADEPISMLDVSIRMGILNLLAQLRDQHGVSYLYITHDLASARYLADETLVLYAGQLMESARSEELMAEPLHPYTRLLLSAVPDPRTSLEKRRVEARGEIPVVINPAPGCRFAGRCPLVMDICRQVTPVVTEPRPGHRVRCHLYGSPAA